MNSDNLKKVSITERDGLLSSRSYRVSVRPKGDVKRGNCHGSAFFVNRFSVRLMDFLLARI